MSKKCTCPNQCKIHDKCSCGNLKKHISDSCLRCYRTRKHKVCNKCNNSRPLKDFPKRKDSVSGIRNCCKDCFNKYKFDECHCGEPKLKRSKKCHKCKLSECLNDSRPIGDFLYRNNKDSNYFSRIRVNANSVAKYMNLKNSGCQCCGLEIALEVCHIKAIKDFDENTPVNIVNHPSNLKCYCKLCHWLTEKEGMSEENILIYLKSHFNNL